MKTWIKTPDGQRFALESLVAYAEQGGAILLQLGGGTFITTRVPCLEGKSPEQAVQDYLDLLDTSLAKLKGDDDAAAFARDLVNWALEREKAASSPGEAQIFRQCAAEVMLRLSERCRR